MLPSRPEALSALSTGVVVANAFSSHPCGQHRLHGEFGRLLHFVMKMQVSQLVKTMQRSLLLLMTFAFVVAPREAHSESAASTNTQCEYVALKTGHPDMVVNGYCFPDFHTALLENSCLAPLFKKENMLYTGGNTWV